MQGTECHQIIVEDWAKMEQPHGTLFLSMPSLLDPSLCPPGTHVIHAFTPDWIDDWKVQTSSQWRHACAVACRPANTNAHLVNVWHLEGVSGRRRICCCLNSRRIYKRRVSAQPSMSGRRMRLQTA